MCICWALGGLLLCVINVDTSCNRWCSSTTYFWLVMVASCVCLVIVSAVEANILRFLLVKSTENFISFWRPFSILSCPQSFLPYRKKNILIYNPSNEESENQKIQMKYSNVFIALIIAFSKWPLVCGVCWKGWFIFNASMKVEVISNIARLLAIPKFLDQLISYISLAALLAKIRK